MAFEDFTTYTEVDPNSRISIIASTITVTAITRDEDAFVYDDKTVGHFSEDLTHLITTNIDNSVSTGNVTSWALTNDIDDSQGLIGGSKSFLELLHVGGTSYILVEVDAGTPYTDSVVLTEGQTYYSTIERDESIGSFGQLTCEIYSDSGRTILVDTLLLSLHSKIDFRYVFAVMSYDDNQAARTTDLTVSNLDLQEVVTQIGFPFFFQEDC